MVGCFALRIVVSFMLRPATGEPGSYPWKLGCPANTFLDLNQGSYRGSLSTFGMGRSLLTGFRSGSKAFDFVEQVEGQRNTRWVQFKVAFEAPGLCNANDADAREARVLLGAANWLDSSVFDQCINPGGVDVASLAKLFERAHNLVYACL
jgi:hypothetical protein